MWEAVRCGYATSTNRSFTPAGAPAVLFLFCSEESLRGVTAAAEHPPGTRRRGSPEIVAAQANFMRAIAETYTPSIADPPREHR